MITKENVINNDCVISSDDQEGKLTFASKVYENAADYYINLSPLTIYKIKC